MRQVMAGALCGKRADAFGNSSMNSRVAVASMGLGDHRGLKIKSFQS